MRIALSRSLAPSRHARLSFMQFVRLWRSRRALAALSPEQLDDVGLSAADAQNEAARPVWDAPASWKC